MKFITISGIDKSGKTSVLNALNKITNYQHFIIERDTTAVLFFAKLLHRPIDYSAYKQLIRQFQAFHHLAVFLYADPQIIGARFAVHDEPQLPGNLSIKDHQRQLMIEWKSAVWRYPLSINTTVLSINETVNIIKEKIDAL